MADAPLDFTDPDDYPRVRAVFRSAGYTDEGITATLHAEGLTAVALKRLPPLLRRTAGGTPLETLIRLFILGVTVEEAAVVRAVAPMSGEQWVRLGLLEHHDGGLRATIQVRCYEDLLVAWDFSLGLRGVLRNDYVMGISASTLTLASLTVRRPGGSALDLGTGSGFQAFLAARHSAHVVAVDKNPRAVLITRFNARLNALDNIEVLEGDLFEPVHGQTFDLIASNPPFIISPDNSYLFLHSGLRGDEICQAVAGQAPAFLNEGGFCQFLANWAVLRDTDWQERLASWFEGSGCDVWVLRRATQPADEYATIWIETGEREEPAEFATFFDNWMAYYEREGIEAVGSGLITMRKSSGHANWFQATDAPEMMGFPSGPDVDRMFSLQDFLRAHDDEALLDSVLQLAPNTRLQLDYQPAPSGWEEVSRLLHRADGLQYEGHIDPHGAALLAVFDGRQPLGEILRALAGSIAGDPASVIAGAVPIVRQLLAQGFLMPRADGA